MRWMSLSIAAWCGLALIASRAGGDEPVSAEADGELEMLTLGGRQFWGDVHFFHDWRIQQNVFTKHYRLLDGRDVRHESGTFEACRDRLNAIIKRDKLPPMSGKGVILIHGIIRSSKSFADMGAALRAKGFQVFGFDYPSTRLSIPESARYLERAIESLQGIEEIHFVVHSMGGLVVRSYLAQSDPPDPRLTRMVMLGVPNLGAGMADRLRSLGLYKFLLGPAGQQLATDAEGLIASLPIPGFEFGIVAGARGDEQGFNPLIPGDDDGTVELARTRLPGAADFVTVRALHSFLMGHSEVIGFTVRFLERGHFRPEGNAEPIPPPVSPDGPGR